MMADQLFNDSSTVGSTADIPDIFDVLEGGEDEGAVRYLLGFNGDEGGLLGQVEAFGGMEVMDKYVGEGMNLGLGGGAYIQAPTTTTVLQTKTPVTIRQMHAAAAATANNKKRDTSGAKAIHNCSSCGKCFTTKFNLKRHINMHCHKSKENGVPIQGPPSASAPAKKADKTLMKSELRMTGLHAANGENKQTKVQHISGGTVLTPNHTIIHSAHTPVAYSRVVTAVPPQTEYQRPEPDSTYKLPSVQTILPVSTVYTTAINSAVAGPGANSFSTIAASCDSSQTVSSVTSSSHHNTDFGPLPADLFDPDSSRSQPPSPTTSPKGAAEADESYSSPVTLTSIPAGWTRKVNFETRRVSYYSPLGRIFNSHEDITQYFKTFNFIVPLGLFNFDPSFMNDSEEEEEEEEEGDSEDEEEEDDELDDEDEEEEEEEEEYSILCAKRRRSDLQYTTSYSGGTLPPSPPPPPGATPASSSPPTFGCSMCESDSMCPAACSNLPRRRLLPTYNQNNSSHYYDNSPSYSIDDELRGYDAVAAAGSCQPPPSTAAGSLSPGEPASGSLPHHLYHAAPGSARRTLQSQSYFAYIQGLRLGSQTMCDWRRELAPTGELVARDNSGLDPHHHVTTIPPWLEKLYSSSQQTQPRVDSLCALRDFMLQEALNVVKFA